MALQDQNSQLAIPEFSPRPGGFKVGDNLTMYGHNMRVTGTKSDGTPILDLADTSQTPQVKPMVRRGQWLRNRLSSLYSDPIYSKASPDVQKYYKDKAYDKWVVPYYKHIGEQPMSKDTFINGGQDPKVRERIAVETLANKSEKEELTVLKTSSKFLSGVSNILNFVDSFNPLQTKEGHQYVDKLLSTSERYYDKQAQDLEDRIQDKGGHDLESKVVALGTDTIFFEASGGSAAARALRIANPTFVKTVTPTIKTLWNGAVTGTLWGATTGSKASELPSDAATFALADLGLSKASSVFFKVFNKFVDHGLVTQTLQEAASDLVSGKGVTKPKVEDIVKGGTEVNKQASRAAAAKLLNEMAQKLEGGESNGAYKKLTPKQQKALLMRLSMVGKQATETSLDSSFNEAMLQDSEASMKQVAPSASKIQQEIDQVIKSHGVDPVQAKLATKLPHHETHIDSPIQHITARISYLTNRLKARGRDELIMSDIDTLKEALRQEKELLKEARAKREVMSKGQTARAVGNVDDASHRAAYEQARREFQEQNPGEDYTKFSNLSKIMKRADELQRGGK